MENIIKAIKNAETVAILGHISEDADSVGSSLAMQYALEKMGKTADIIFSGELEARLGFMNAKAIFKEEAKAEYDLCLCLDSGDMKRLGDRVEIFEKAKSTASIDHHITNTEFAEFNYVVPDASATGEILYDVIAALGIDMDRTIAEYLFIAIASDTGSFKYSNVSPKTLRITAELLEQGIDNAYLSRMLFDTEFEAVMHFKGQLMSRVETYYDGRLAVLAVDKTEFEKNGVLERDMGDIVNIARMVQGAEIAVSVRETEEKVKVSFRSNGKYDVGEIAMHFGGGGHKMASGAASSKLGFVEMKEKIIEFCGDLFND